MANPWEGDMSVVQSQVTTPWEDQVADMDAVAGGGGTARPATITPPQRFAEPPGSEKTLAGFGKNFAPSGVENMNAGMSFTDPQKAIKMLGQLFSSDGLSALKDYYVKSYGSIEQAKQTAYNDPIGFLSDISLLGGPMTVAGKLGGASKAGKAAQVAGNVLQNADPVAASIGAMRLGGGGLLTAAGVPQGIYRSTLKPSTAKTNKFQRGDVRKRVINELMDNEIPISHQGVEKLQGVVDVQTQKLDDMITSADKAGTMIPIRDVLSELDKLRIKLSDPISNPTASKDVATINKFTEDWLRQIGPVSEIRPSEARALRQTMDEKINWTSIPTKAEGLPVAIEKATAHGARQALGDAAGSGDQARIVSGLLDAQEPLKNAAARLDNNNAIGLRETMVLGGGIGGAASGHLDVKTALAIVAGGMLLNKEAQQKAAQAIYNSSKIDKVMKRNLIRTLFSQGGRAGENITRQQEQPQ